ncbi:hypothetical protein [Streptomyces sp. NPDC056796]|uniref:hypothetical protein n=1 Tax=unclassified Streptomyces TaxID=2593676 RepID=UPI0036CF6B66
MASSYGPPPAATGPEHTPEAGWSDKVSELAGRLEGIMAGLRALDLDGVPPASVYHVSGADRRADRETADAAL